MVPYKYISDSMGHSGGGDITSNYIGAYPLEKMLQYNKYLLNEVVDTDANTTKNSGDTLFEMLKNMSKEDKEKAIKLLMEQ